MIMNNILHKLHAAGGLQLQLPSHMEVDAEVGLSQTVQEVQGSIPTKGATLFSVISDMIAICQAK